MAGDVDDLERRLRAVEERLGLADPAPDTTTDRPGVDPETFWVLTRLRRQLAGVPGGGVVYAGSVETPAGAAEWQYGLSTETLLDPDDAATESVADRLSALGHPVRLRLLRAVLQGSHSAAELAGLDGLGTSGQVYHHLRILTAAGWLRSAGRSRVEVPAERMVPLLVALTVAR